MYLEAQERKVFEMPGDIVTDHVILTIYLGGRDITTIRVERLDYIAAMNGAAVAQKFICGTVRKKLNKESTARIGFVPWYDKLISGVANDPDELPQPALFDTSSLQTRARRKPKNRVVHESLT